MHAGKGGGTGEHLGLKFLAVAFVDVAVVQGNRGRLELQDGAGVAAGECAELGFDLGPQCPSVVVGAEPKADVEL